MICGLFSLFWCLLRASWLLLLQFCLSSNLVVCQNILTGDAHSTQCGVCMSSTSRVRKTDVLTSWTESQSVAGEPQERVDLVVERKEDDGKGCTEQKSRRERVTDLERPAGRIPALLSRHTMPWFPTDFIWATPSHFLVWKFGVWHLLRLLSLAAPTTCTAFLFFILHLPQRERCLLAKKEQTLRKNFWRLFEPPQHSLYRKVFKSPFSLKELGTIVEQSLLG